MRPILLAFGFGNVAMLGWLAAAAAPLVIHLWSRHRFREAPWAAMHFLLAALRKNSRRMQLQQWILLAVRTLIILFVVLAVAEPYGERILAGGATAPTHRILLLDASYSMAYRTSDTTAFARAKQMAARLVRECRAGDVFTVIRLATQAEEVVSPAVIDHATAAEQIESLKESQSSANLQAGLVLVQTALTQTSGVQRMPAQKEVVIFSDLQRLTWADAQSSADRKSELVELFQSIAKRVPVAVIDVGKPQASNLVVTRFEAAESLITPNRAAAFNVVLHEFGTTPRPKCRVELLVNGSPVTEQTVDIPAGGDATLSFNHRFATIGSHSLAVRVAGDALEIDNTRWLAVHVTPAVRVLCVAGAPNAAKYVADALNPGTIGDSSLQPKIISEGEFADASLADYACVVLCNVAQLTANEAARLTHYADSGGGIIVFLGDRVDAASYNALAIDRKPGQKVDSKSLSPSSAGGSLALDPGHPQSDASRSALLPARLGPFVTNRQFGLDPLDYRHPIVAPFRGRERAGLLTTPVTRYVRMQLAQNPSGIETAAALPNGDPFIVTSSLGHGRVVLVATDGSLSSVEPQTGERWTSWPTWPSFLPLVREMLSYATRSQQARWQQQVGTPLSGRIPDATTINQLKIRRPDGRLAAIATRDTPTGREWSYSDTDLSGIYIIQGLFAEQSQQFAVNLNTSESDLAKADASQFPREVKVKNNWQIGPSRQTADLLTQSSWNQPLLWSTLALLFVEAFLAWLFGRGAL